MTSGASIFTAAIAVTLASVRLMPMTVALMPMLKVEGKTKRWQLLVASHFVAVTAWVYAMKHLPDMPREGRLPFFMGFGGGITSFVFCMTGISYMLIEEMPVVVAAALFLLTPVYFTCSLWGASRLAYDKVAMITGLVFGPFFFLMTPGLDLLWTGLVGGTLAYAGVKIYRRFPR